MVERLFFSVLMCVYNKTELLEYAIRSVREQSEHSWELLILDNSDNNRENTWKILTQSSETDHKIKIFRNNENVGWAKGASQLLKMACGKYMTFLAADDFLLPDALTKVKKAATEHEPDVLWVGNKYFEQRKDSLWEIGDMPPCERRVLNVRQAENIIYVMEHVFYNAFFHYVQVDFLRQQNIDFYHSGYGDCAGMTRVLSEAQRMVVLDQSVYGLTANTSQSRGTFYWDGEQYIFSDQWQSVRSAYRRDVHFSFHELKYCATVILKNEIGNMMSLANGSKCVNKEMNPVSKNLLQRLLQIKQILENHMIQEMAQFYGRYQYEQEIMAVILRLLAGYQQESAEDRRLQVGWLGKFLKAAYCQENSEIVEKKVMTMEDLEDFAEALTDPQNTGMFGLGVFLKMAGRLREEGIAEENRHPAERVLQFYQDWKGKFIEQIWNDFGNSGALRDNGKIELAASCKYVMEN